MKKNKKYLLTYQMIYDNIKAQQNKSKQMKGALQWKKELMF